MRIIFVSAISVVFLQETVRSTRLTPVEDIGQAADGVEAEEMIDETLVEDVKGVSELENGVARARPGSMVGQFLTMTLRFSFYYSLCMVVGGFLSSLKLNQPMEAWKMVRRTGVDGLIETSFAALGGVPPLLEGWEEYLKGETGGNNHFKIASSGPVNDSFNGQVDFYSDLHKEWSDLMDKSVLDDKDVSAYDAALSKGTQIQLFFSDRRERLRSQSEDLPEEERMEIMESWDELESEWDNEFELAVQLRKLESFRMINKQRVFLKKILVSLLRVAAPIIGKTLRFTESIVTKEMESNEFRKGLSEAIERFEVDRLESFGRSLGELVVFEADFQKSAVLELKLNMLIDRQVKPLFVHMAYFLAYVGVEYGPSMVIDLMDLLVRNPQIASLLVPNVNEDTVVISRGIKDSIKNLVRQTAPQEMQQLFRRIDPSIL